MMRRVCLIGGSGQLGHELRQQAPVDWEIIAPSRVEFDMAAPERMLSSLTGLKPDLVINCSAFHAVDLCESRFLDALTVNAVAVLELARWAKKAGAPFVTFSTDYVFDGVARTPYVETAPVNPLQCYGISKVTGERAVQADYPEGAIVIRSCGLYGHAASRQKGGNFVLNRLQDAATKSQIEVGSDLTCTPTSAADLAAGVLGLLGKKAPAGIYHLTNSGSCDWASFTTEIMRLKNKSMRVTPVDRRGAYAPARRPAYSVLDCGRAASLGVALRPWQEALEAFLRDVD